MGKCDAQVTWKNYQPTTLSNMIFTIILLSVKIIEFAELCIDTNGTPIQYSAFQFRRELNGKTPMVLKYLVIILASTFIHNYKHLRGNDQRVSVCATSTPPKVNASDRQLLRQHYSQQLLTLSISSSRLNTRNTPGA